MVPHTSFSALRAAVRRRWSTARAGKFGCTSRDGSTTGGVPPAAAASVVHISANLKTLADVEDLVLTYGVQNAHIPSRVRPLAVVKVGGEVISKDIDNLVASLRFMREFGLLPIVIHGGGPQLNDELAKAGVSPQYIGGHRVTDAATMTVAQRVFESANDTLAEALAKAGLPVQQFKGGVFNAQVADPKLGLVGEITSVVRDGVNAAIASGRIPVLTSLGVHSAQVAAGKVGAVLNINADVAARELAIALQPLKVVFISAGGGWKEEGVVVSEVDMANDFARLENRDYNGRQGTLLKLREMKMIIDKLPAVSSVTIASASALSSQLLPHRGPGTQIRKGVKLQFYNGVGSTDRVALEGLLRASGKSGAPGLALLASQAACATIAGIIATEGYSAVAIVLKPAGASGEASEREAHTLACMAVSPVAMAEGVEAALWKEVKSRFGGSYPSGAGLSWSALPATDIPTGVAHVRANGAASIPDAFPALSASRSAQHATETVSSGAADGSVAMRWKPVAGAGQGLTPKHSVTLTASPSTSAAKNGGSIRVGLLGARGFVGRELLKLISGHPDMIVTAAGSRALAGREVATALEVPQAAAAVSPGLTFSDIGVEQLKSRAHPAVDVWVLALPNGLCAPHAAAIEAGARAAGAPVPLLIDLSADMRFDTSGQWAYGLPERPGSRAALAVARKISNPGCYATGAQAALLPLLPHLSEGAMFAWNPAHKPHVFGVSGYSGAGTSPSDKNDPARLRDNVLAYALTGHIHEREIGWHCGLLSGAPHAAHAAASAASLLGLGASSTGVGGVAFMPHVAPFFQGIHLTVTGHLSAAVGAGGKGIRDITPAAIAERFAAFYAGERLVRVLGVGKDGKSLQMPDVASHGAYQHGVTVGGFTYDPATGRLAMVSTIDNLLKGAASQCMQNMNIALGLQEYTGIPLQ